jgi:hypothetical protein
MADCHVDMAKLSGELSERDVMITNYEEKISELREDISTERQWREKAQVRPAHFP